MNYPQAKRVYHDLGASKADREGSLRIIRKYENGIHLSADRQTPGHNGHAANS